MLQVWTQMSIDCLSWALIFSDQHLLISEFPSDVSVENRSLTVTYLEPRSWLLSQTDNNSDALSFFIASALERSLWESNSYFVTIGNDPEITIGIFKQDEEYIYVFDSHSRDKYGRCCPNGKAVHLQLHPYRAFWHMFKTCPGPLVLLQISFLRSLQSLSCWETVNLTYQRLHQRYVILNLTYFRNNL